jgi:hypothetical protein
MPDGAAVSVIPQEVTEQDREFNRSVSFNVLVTDHR